MSEVCVQVAVRIRPLLPKEILHKHKVCVQLIPGSSQVRLDLDRVFSFDYAFDRTASQDEVYESCVQSLVRSLVDGYNATVFCYGQTGSGKTYTLRGESLDDKGGIIDHVAQDVFLFLKEKGGNGNGVDAKVQVSYLELYMEELRDLLELDTSRKDLHIREDEKGNTVVVGAKEVVVASSEELLSVVEMGNALRHTGTTGMNEHSSRSHAVLMLQLIQCCPSNSLKLIPLSKLCLVDLAGSERAGKTGNTGVKLKESVHINTGLLALGNVIRALSDSSRNRGRNRHNSTYIPYRDAKITRLLRDSLGGSAHTLMIACVSPSDHSLPETVSVLQFASNARHIYNHPADRTTPTVNKSNLTNWDSGKARHSELEYQLQTLRELLKEKEREIAMEREKSSGKLEEEQNFKHPSHMMITDPERTVTGGGLSQYYILAQEASLLLADIPGPISSHSFKQQIQDWQERLTAINHSHQADESNYSEDDGDQNNHATVLALKEELRRVKETQERKDAELRHLKHDMETLLQEKTTHLQALQEERDRNRILTEQLADQEILINHLRRHSLIDSGATPGAAINTGKRPHSVPLDRPSCRHEPTRRTHTSPPACSLDRVMAGFKVRSNLLLAEHNEENVYCPVLEQQTEMTEKEVEEDACDKMKLRHLLSRTWTKQQNIEKDTGTSNGNPLAQQSQQAKDCKEPGTKENPIVQKARGGIRSIERMIRDLSVNISKKEELIKELVKTDKETQAVVRYIRHNDNGREAGVLERLSVQSQQAQADVFRSLRHMREQRAQLQSRLKQQSENSDNNEQHDEIGDQTAGDRVGCQNKLQELSKEKQLQAVTWLEEEEERVLQRRATLQLLEEELKRREEVLLQKKTYLQQKDNLERKMLRSSQALSQELLRSSTQLEALEAQLHRNSSGKQPEGVTTKGLQERRDILKKKRDILDAKLKNNKLLTVEEENLNLQLEETIEFLDAVLELKNRSIRDKQKKLSITDSPSYQSQSAEPIHLCDVIRKLEKLSAPDASELLVQYFSKVIHLREVEKQLSLRCEELELQVGEKDVMLIELKMAMQRLTLDADRRLTEQHREHQNNIRLLLQEIKEDGSETAQQAIQDRLQHLEKELIFNETSKWQLEKKLKENLPGTPHPADPPSHSQKLTEMNNEQICTSAHKLQMDNDEAQTCAHIAKTHSNTHSEQTDKTTHSGSHMTRNSQQAPCTSSSNHKACKTQASENTHTHTQPQREGVAGLPEDRSPMTPVRLSHRQLRQIPPPHLHVSGFSTRRRQSVMTTSNESLLEDSIEAPRK